MVGAIKKKESTLLMNPFLLEAPENRPSKKAKTESLPFRVFLLPFQKPNKDVLLERVISGGQTGADQAGLEAAFNIGITTGGWAPPNFSTSSGPNLTLKNVYGLKELPLSSYKSIPQAYVLRSKRNIDESSGTIAFRCVSSLGTDKSIKYCLTSKWNKTDWETLGSHSQYRPCLVITSVSTDVRSSVIDSVVYFIVSNHLRTVNIVGHRSDLSAQTPNYSQSVRIILEAAFTCIPFLKKEKL